MEHGRIAHQQFGPTRLDLDPSLSTIRPGRIVATTKDEEESKTQYRSE
jgi:hypothetical protein